MVAFPSGCITCNESFFHSTNKSKGVQIAGHGSVNFVIIADGKILYISPVKKSHDPAEHVEVNIAGKNTLELVSYNANDNIDNDHADWADAKLFTQ
ncbi:NPCBM/NEW2 domain-containing protein [Bacillus wiedmannii]|uniref:NPCBM/NEW2 domain-containing protein n=1 Tax=Bacillus wiedmannii TaxID=1890302 RepID=UPI002E21B4D9|nr:NPCBM/NEW2 domain-containing protein [Bacillus wiedmannii]